VLENNQTQKQNNYNILSHHRERNYLQNKKHNIKKQHQIKSIILDYDMSNELASHIQYIVPATLILDYNQKIDISSQISNLIQLQNYLFLKEFFTPKLTPSERMIKYFFKFFKGIIDKNFN